MTQTQQRFFRRAVHLHDADGRLNVAFEHLEAAQLNPWLGCAVAAACRGTTCYWRGKHRGRTAGISVMGVCVRTLTIAVMVMVMVIVVTMSVVCVVG